MHWRQMTEADLAEVAEIAALAFPDHRESLSCFAERLTLSPALCFVLEDGGALFGYLIAYPWPEGSIPPLDSLLGALPTERDALYLHDLALRPEARGTGQMKNIVRRLSEAARRSGARRIALVSVNDSVGAWRANGFEIADNDPAIRAKLASYGDGAHYMTRTI
ncbi:MAG: GNAT family N-acetyltransferase [Pseudomonadota bacterium]